MRHNKAQSMLEYTVLLCIILSSLLIMQVYLGRAYKGKIREDADSLGQLYSPGHTTSLITTDTTTHSVSYTGGQTNSGDLPNNNIIPGGVNIPDGMTVNYADSNTDFHKQEAIDAFTTEQ